MMALSYKQLRRQGREAYFPGGDPIQEYLEQRARIEKISSAEAYYKGMHLESDYVDWFAGWEESRIDQEKKDKFGTYPQSLREDLLDYICEQFGTAGGDEYIVVDGLIEIVELHTNYK